MLRQDNCQASLHNTISSKCPTEKAVGWGWRSSVCVQAKPEERRRRRRVGIICGTTLRAEPSAAALLLPDHNQMCQVCPNRNDCVKAIFSNLSDFRVAPTIPHYPPCLLKDKCKRAQQSQAPMNACCTLCLQHSHDETYTIWTHRGKTRPVVLTNNHPPNFHASALLNQIGQHIDLLLFVQSNIVTTSYIP